MKVLECSRRLFWSASKTISQDLSIRASRSSQAHLQELSAQVRKFVNCGYEEQQAKRLALSVAWSM